MADIGIRPADEADIAAVLSIYNHAVEHTTATYDETPRSHEQQQQWFAERRSLGQPVLVADDAGRVVGWSALSTFRARSAYRFTLEDALYVAPDAQGGGVGRALLTGLVEAAPALGLHSIMATIDADAAVSLHLHESLGFKRVGFLEQVGYKFERWLDVVLLQRRVVG